MSTPGKLDLNIQAFRRRHIFSHLKSLEGCETIDEVVEKSGMNFVAGKRDLWYEKPLIDEEGNESDEKMELVKNPDHVAIVREDDHRYLGTTGTGYGIIQYPKVFEFTEVLAEEGVAGFKYGGITGAGERAYLVMQTSECLSLGPESTVECYFYATTSHNRKTGMNIVPAPLWNKGSVVLSGPPAITFRHTKNVGNKMAQAKRTIKKVKEYFVNFEQSFRDLSSVTLTDDLLETYLLSLFPNPEKKTQRTENIRHKIKITMKTDPAFQTQATNNTLLGAYFSVCMFADFFMPVHKKEGRDESTARIQSALDGAAAKRKAEALAFARKMYKEMN